MQHKPHSPSSYPQTDRSRAKRLGNRAAYDHAAVHAILDAGVIAHIGYVIDGQPYVTPTAYWRHGNQLFWHGSSASRMLRHQKEGYPVCVTVSHLDGFVLARSAFHHSVNYRSVMAFGRAFIVDDIEEKRAALDAFVERLFPGRMAQMRPHLPQELKATTVIGMEIEEAVAKSRNGPPVDDEEDYALPVWAGVIPVTTTVGKPVDDPRQHASAQVDALGIWNETGARMDEILTKLT